MEYKLGWKRSLPDLRDYKFSAKLDVPLPESVDLRPELPGVWDQGQLSSCVANASTALVRQVIKKEGGNADEHLSRLFLYYTTRELEGTTKLDNGVTLRDTFKAMNSKGICKEDLWPYIPQKVKNKPTNKSYQDATRHLAKTYFSINQNEEELKQCLAEGYGFVFGFVVYESFMSEEVKKTGIVPIPKTGEKVYGGHGVMCCGFNNKGFIVRNSWSSNWGDQGYCYMPKEFILNPSLCMEFYTLHSI